MFFFDHDERVVKLHRMHLSRCGVKGKNIVLIRVPTVHVVDQVFAFFDKGLRRFVPAAKSGPIACVRVFNDIEAAIFQMWPEFAKGHVLMIHFVPTIVDNHVKRTIGFGDAFQKGGVRLIADFDLGSIQL